VDLSAQVARAAASHRAATPGALEPWLEAAREEMQVEAVRAVEAVRLAPPPVRTATYSKAP